MALKDVVQEIEGYREIEGEIRVLKKYGSDYKSSKGVVDQIIAQLHPPKIVLKLTEIIPETDSTRTLRFTGKNHNLPPFQAGQYLNLFVDVHGIRTSRPYSISSPPTRTGYYDVTIRRVAEGFVSSYLLDELKVGDELESTSPSGNFTYNPLFHGQDLVFLAGGSGITPFMSMIREAAERGLTSRRIQLLYGSRSEMDVIFQDELTAIAGRHANISWKPVISDPARDYRGARGLLTAETIRETVGPPAAKTFYICGPEIMYDFCRRELVQLGVPRAKIRVEAYGPPSDVTRQPGWPPEIGPGDMFTVTLRGGKSIPAKAAEPLMNALERQGIVVPASCRSGECSLCRTKMLSGKVFHPQGVRLRKSDRQFGYIHPCMAYPLSDLEILL
ncbi:MAG: FAD-binding oxidoreductase [Thermodesulfobacteriota bacterium]